MIQLPGSQFLVDEPCVLRLHGMVYATSETALTVGGRAELLLELLTWNSTTNQTDNATIARASLNVDTQQEWMELLDQTQLFPADLPGRLRLTLRCSAQRVLFAGLGIHRVALRPVSHEPGVQVTASQPCNVGPACGVERLVDGDARPSANQDWVLLLLEPSPTNAWLDFALPAPATLCALHLHWLPRMAADSWALSVSPPSGEAREVISKWNASLNAGAEWFACVGGVSRARLTLRQPRVGQFGLTEVDLFGFGGQSARCELQCRNGGSCVAGPRCVCAKGWRGRVCDEDIDVRTLLRIFSI